MPTTALQIIVQPKGARALLAASMICSCGRVSPAGSRHGAEADASIDDGASGGAELALGGQP